MNAFTTVATLALLLTSASASAATTYVAPGKGTLQAAIDAAAPGDTLQLGDGTYKGALVIKKDLTIEGLSLSDSIIKCGGAQFGIKITKDVDVHLDSLQVTAANDMAGVFIDSLAFAELSSVAIVNTTTDFGAVMNLGDALIDDNSVISGNQGTVLGGGISNIMGTLQLDGVTVIGNQGYMGGGLHNSNGDATIENSSFSLNDATSIGGGYSNHNLGGSVDFTGTSSFSNNTSGSGLYEQCFDVHGGCAQ